MSNFKKAKKVVFRDIRNDKVVVLCHGKGVFRIQKNPIPGTAPTLFLKELRGDQWKMIRTNGELYSFDPAYHEMVEFVNDGILEPRHNAQEVK